MRDDRVAELIHRHRDRIVAVWKREAVRAAAARGLSDPELQNLIGGVLDALGAGGDLSEAVRDEARSHLGGRIALGYELAEVVHEFTLLEEAVLEVGAGLPLDEQPSRAERERVSAGIRKTIVQMTELFQEHMALDEQRDKRYLRRIQAIADRARAEASWGLGLAVVKAVAEAHGGTASVESTRAGTTFSVDLPRDARGQPHGRA